MTEVRCGNTAGVAKGRICNHLLFKTDGVIIQIMCPKCGGMVHYSISELQYRAVLEAAGLERPDLEWMPDDEEEQEPEAEEKAGKKPASDAHFVGKYGPFKPKSS